MSYSKKTLSRREFLRAVGVVTGGAALGSLGVLAACRDSEDTSAHTTAQSHSATSTANTATSEIVTSTAGSATVTTSSIASSTMGIGAPTALPEWEYVVPDEYPSLLSERYGCASGVAADRWYNASHFWTKEIGDDRVVIGLTDKMQRLVGDISRFYFLVEVGDLIRRGHVCAGVEAYKTFTDVIAPVSGKIIQLNQALMTRPEIITPYPYSHGWVAVLQLTDPQELEDLIGPSYYAYLQAVEIPSTAPPFRS